MPVPRKDLVPRTQMNAEAAGCRAVLAALALAAAGCLASGDLEDAGISRALRVPPFVWCSGDAARGRRTRNLLGVFCHRVAEDVPPEKQADSHAPISRRSLDVLWPVCHSGTERYADGRRIETRWLAPAFWMRRESEKTGAGGEYTRLNVNVLGIVLDLDSDNYGRGRKAAQFLWPLGHYFAGERDSPEGVREYGRSFRFLPFVRVERIWSVQREQAQLAKRDEPMPYALGRYPHAPRRSPTSGPPRLVRVRVLQPLFGYERDGRRRTKQLFVLGGTYAEAGGGRRPWGLVHFGRGPSTDAEFGMFWNALLVRRWGSRDIAAAALREDERGRPSERWRLTKWLFRGSPRRAIGFAPVFSYESDWETGRKRFTLLNGLWSWGRTGSRTHGRFLWVFGWGRNSER